VTDLLQQLSSLMGSQEDEHLEFKEARSQFRFEELVRYCCALANERGGRIILGVTDRRPRRVVGTRAFQDLQRTKLSLVETLRLRVETLEIQHPDGRVLVFEVPSRPLGLPMQVNGAYWMRSGESVVAMTPDVLKRIFDEAQPDFSAGVCPQLRLEELDPRAIEVFRTRWAERSRRDDLLEIGAEPFLHDADLLSVDGITYAALILLGTGPALLRHLPHAEMIYEYRVEESSIEYQQRKELRRGFLLDHDDLWAAVDAHNEVFSYRDGPFRRDILSFDEGAVREAVLNAVSHRDYRLQGSTFIRQTRTKISIVSPGGFPPGVGPDNVLFKQVPRNRRLAEALARCGLVERSGQGADRMFATAIQEGKLPPDFGESDENQVGVTLHGTVQDEAFIAFLEGLAREKQRRFRVRDLFVLDAVHRGRPIPDDLRDHVSDLLGIGALERTGRNQFVLARRFYVLKGQPGEHTRRRGLDRDTRKELLFQHIQSSGRPGTPFDELAQVLPGASRNELKVLLRELKEDGRIHTRGITRAARWYPGPAEEGLE
jgi:ATP-dependent DNA helicase RecG